MPMFVVERFIPSLGPEGVDAQAQRDGALVNGVEVVRHVRTSYFRDVLERNARDRFLQTEWQ